MLAQMTNRVLLVALLAVGFGRHGVLNKGGFSVIYRVDTVGKLLKIALTGLASKSFNLSGKAISS